jgi:hypothetical protein
MTQSPTKKQIDAVGGGGVAAGAGGGVAADRRRPAGALAHAGTPRQKPPQGCPRRPRLRRPRCLRLRREKRPPRPTPGTESRRLEARKSGRAGHRAGSAAVVRRSERTCHGGLHSTVDRLFMGSPPMGMSNQFTFFDRIDADRLWKMSWKNFLALAPSMTENVEELISFGFDPSPTEPRMRDILAKRTLRWTISRCTPQFFIMDELLSWAPALGRRMASVGCDRINDPWALVALAVQGYEMGEVDRRTLAAVLKLHNARKPGADLLSPAQSGRTSRSGAHRGSTAETAISMAGSRRVRRRHRRLCQLPGRGGYQTIHCVCKTGMDAEPADSVSWR